MQRKQKNHKDMKILLSRTSIDFSNYHSAVLHETFGVISFCVRNEIDDRCLQLPLTFASGKDAKEAYCLILQGRNTGTNCVSLCDFWCSWPSDLAMKVEQYAQHMYDFDRPIQL